MVLILLSLACIKPTPPLATGADRPVAVVGVIDAAGATPAADTPDRFDAALLAEARVRKLAPALTEGADVLRTCTDKRTTEQRTEALQGAAPTLLVETAPVFYSELNGQYRWSVGVKVTLAVAGHAVQSASFDVPVFLRYHHEREAEAVDAAAPVVARHVGELLDNWLRSGG